MYIHIYIYMHGTLITCEHYICASACVFSRIVHVLTNMLCHSTCTFQHT